MQLASFPGLFPALKLEGISLGMRLLAIWLFQWNHALSNDVPQYKVVQKLLLIISFPCLSGPPEKKMGIKASNTAEVSGV